MKIHLLQDAKVDGKLCKKGDVVEVKEELGHVLIAGRIAGNPKKEKKAAAIEEKPADSAQEKGARKAKK